MSKTRPVIAVPTIKGPEEVEIIKDYGPLLITRCPKGPHPWKYAITHRKTLNTVRDFKLLKNARRAITAWLPLDDWTFTETSGPKLKALGILIKSTPEWNLELPL